MTSNSQHHQPGNTTGGGSSASSYYQAVQQILSQISQSTLTQFQKLTTDESRVALVSQLAFVQSGLRVAAPTNPSKKSTDAANRSRQKGNELYQAGKLKDALACYTVSILSAPVAELDGENTAAAKAGSNGVDDQRGKEVASAAEAAAASSNSEFVLALGNRSACLLQMKKYVECLDDLDVALRYGYPDHLRYKLLDRRARCLIELNRYEDAIEALQQLQADLALTKLDSSQRSAIALNTEKKINFCTSSVFEPGSGGEQKQQQGETSAATGSATGSPAAPTISGVKSERFPGASEALDVRFQQDRGRYGVAARDIGVGEVLLVEAPHVCVPTCDVYATRCYSCFKLIDVAVGCHRCTRVRYCSEACRQHSWDAHHGVECPFLDLLLGSGTGTMSHLVLKLLVVTGLQRVLKHRRNPRGDADSVQQSLFTNAAGVYVGGYVGLYGLLSHSTDRSPTDLLQYTLLAVWLTNILKRAGFVDASARPAAGDGDDKQHEQSPYVIVGGTILRFLQIVACNGVEVTELQLGANLHKSNPVSIGLALYPTVSLFNHSCDPLLELVFHDDRVAVRAVQNVTAGRELVIDYGYVYYSTPAKQRRSTLRSQYFFACQCPACVEDWGLKSTLNTGLPALKCTSCGTPLPAPAHEDSDADSATCARCGAAQTRLHERLESLLTSQTKAEAALVDARKFRVDAATIAALERHLTLIDKFFVLPWKDYVVCLSTLKQCYRMQDEFGRNYTVPLLKGNVVSKVVS